MVEMISWVQLNLLDSPRSSAISTRCLISWRWEGVRDVLPMSETQIPPMIACLLWVWALERRMEVTEKMKKTVKDLTAHRQRLDPECLLISIRVLKSRNSTSLLPCNLSSNSNNHLAKTAQLVVTMCHLMVRKRLMEVPWRFTHPSWIRTAQTVVLLIAARLETWSSNSFSSISLSFPLLPFWVPRALLLVTTIPEASHIPSSTSPCTKTITALSRLSWRAQLTLL